MLNSNYFLSLTAGLAPHHKQAGLARLAHDLVHVGPTRVLILLKQRHACVCFMFAQVAGVEGRHVVLLVSDNNITDEAMLADINGLLNTGEVTGVN